MNKVSIFGIGLIFIFNFLHCSGVLAENKTSASKPAYRMGIEYASEGRFSEAENWFNENLKRNEKDFTSISALAVIKDLKTGKITENYAISFFKGLNLIQNEATDRGVKELRGTIALDPKYPRPYNVLGVLYAASGDTNAALKFFQQAIALNPGYPEACFNLAALYQSLGNREEALKYYTKVIAQDPGAIDAMVNTAAIYASQANYTQAVRSYENALTRDCDNADIHYDLALVYFMADDLANFKKQLEAARALYRQKGDTVGIKKVEECVARAIELENKIYHPK